MPRGFPIAWTVEEIAKLKHAAVVERCTLGQIVLSFKGKFSADVIKRKMTSEKMSRPRTTRVDWPEADEATLHQAWKDGCTAGQTKIRLKNRYSRNACIGKLRRKFGQGFGAGLDDKGAGAHAENDFARRSAGAIVATRKSIARGTKPKAPIRRARTGLTRIEADALPEPEAIGPLDTFPDDSASTPTTCRAIKGDPTVPGWRCCGQDVLPGRPYCPTHCVKFVDLSGTAGKAPHWLVSKGAMARALA